MLGRLAIAGTVVLGVGCGDDVVQKGTTSTTASTSTTTSAGSGGGDGGGGSGSAGGCGGGAPPFEAVHGCDPAALTDRTGEGTVTIENGYIMSQFVYEPRCVLVSCAATVRFHIADGTSFSIHPLQGGTSPTPDPESQFGFVNDTMLQEVSFQMGERGTFPYYCTAHASVGMAGVVYVE
jgi:plastocyanin